MGHEKAHVKTLSFGNHVGWWVRKMSEIVRLGMR